MAVIPMWAGHYTGLEFKDQGRDCNGLDCWGLTRLILSEQFGIAVPSYLNLYKGFYDGKNIIKAVTTESAKYLPVQAGCERPGDIFIARNRFIFPIIDTQTIIFISKGCKSHIAPIGVGQIFRYISPITLKSMN